MTTEILMPALWGLIGAAAFILVQSTNRWRRDRRRRRLYRPSENPPKVYPDRPRDDKAYYGVRKTKAKIRNGKRIWTPPRG